MNPTNPLQGSDSPTLDYDALRREGMRQLERLAGSEWTDFNPHDPGITILEQYCYALTELAYRCDFPIPDLLSRDGKEAYGSLFSPAQILTSRPVTLADLRKLVIDVPGVKNAWIEKVADYSPKVYHHRYGDPIVAEAHERLIQLQSGEGGTPIDLKGLYRVLIESADVSGGNNGDIVREVAKRLHAHRPLCMDFESVEAMERQTIQVKSYVEIAAGANPEEVYLAILGKIEGYVSPSVRFYTLAESLASGKRADEIFDGPALDHGFIDTTELSAMQRKTGLRVSDFIHEIMDVEGVSMVKYLALSGGGAWQNWWLNLEPNKVPVFDVDSDIRLERQQIEVSADYYALAKERYRALQKNSAKRPALPDDVDIVPPAGRDRRVGRYYSAQHHFPEVYGLGERGLPFEADRERRAQLKQLQAYLLFFDQVLANEFAQLAHIGDLLGFDADKPQTYFSADVDDPALRLDGLWTNDDDRRRERLARLVENPESSEEARGSQAVDWARKNRFLDHLLARFAEQFVDYVQFRELPKDGSDLVRNKFERLARDKQAWLSGYPGLSAGRGTGFNALSPSAGKIGQDSNNCSGLERRLRHKLGLEAATSADDAPRFYLLEHVLLRPVPADNGHQALPLLVDARSADPYSLQLSLVFPGALAPFDDRGFRRFVEQTVREETPAHLLAYVLWLDVDAMASFKDAYQTWSESQRVWRESGRQGTIGLPLNTSSDAAHVYRLLDARDRLIDLLAIGQTYPLADLPVEYTAIVALKQAGRITIISSQPGVVYQLLDKDDGTLKGEGKGTGDNLVLWTPPITKDTGFKIKAVKKMLSVTLFQAIDIKVGLDTGLQAKILVDDFLDRDVKNPGVEEPRIVDYGTAPSVEIQNSQAGVDYRLVCVQADPQGADLVIEDSRTKVSIALKYLSEKAVSGTSDAIRIQTREMKEDIDIRILAVRNFEGKEKQKAEQALLTVTLPLKVRANVGLSVAVDRSQLDYGSGTAVVVKAAQASVSYQLFARPLAESEFVRDDKAPSAFEIPGVAGLRVTDPQRPTPDAVAIGAAISGNGADLALPIDNVKEDTLVVIRAGKAHKTREGRPPISSSVQLFQAAAVLVRPGPDSAFPLRLKLKEGEVPAGSGLQKGTIYQVLNGQPGVFYYFRRAKSRTAWGLPVYFHKDGRGIGQLQVEIDFALTGSLPTPPPEWDCPADFAADDTLSIRAVIAQTGLEIVFERTVASLLVVSGGDEL